MKDEDDSEVANTIATPHRLRFTRSMPRTFRAPLLSLALLVVASMPRAKAQPAAPQAFADSPKLQSLVNTAARTALDRFSEKKLLPTQLAVTLVDLGDAAKPARASASGRKRSRARTWSEGESTRRQGGPLSRSEDESGRGIS